MPRQSLSGVPGGHGLLGLGLQRSTGTTATAHDIEIVAAVYNPEHNAPTAGAVGEFHETSILEQVAGLAPAYNDFADRRLTTWATLA